MASSYTGLGTELMTTGENAGNWGTKTNTNLQIIEQIAGGYIEQDVAGGAQTTTLSVSDGSTGAVLGHRIIKFTGTITGNQTVTIPLDVQQMYVLVNGTSGAYTVQFKYATGSGSSVTFAATDKGTKIVYATADHATNPNLVDTGISSTGAHDLDGNELILDADADTSITADTDDQIDIKVGGTDRARITTGAIAPSSSDGVALGTSALEFSDLYLADGAVVYFGDDQDVSLTHVADTGLLLSSTDQLQFNDSGTYIYSNADGDLDLVSDGTAIDSINLESAGGITLDAGSTTHGITYEDDGTAMLQITNSSSDVIVKPLVDAKDIIFQQYDGTEVARVEDGVQFNVSATTASSSATTGALITGGGLGVAADAYVGDDIYLISDSAVLGFGADSEIKFTHVADTGLTLKHTATADDKPIILTLQTGETDIAADDIIGTINFQAPDEGTGTDAILVAAGIEAVSEGDFSSSSNATKLSFKTGASEAASEKVAISSAGNLSLTASNTELRFYEGSNYVGFEAPALSGDQIWVLPDSDGSNGHVIKTDGSGNLSFAAQSVSSLAADDISAGDAAVTIGNGSTSADVTLDSGDDVVIDAAGGNVEFKDAGTLQLTLDMDGTSGEQIIQLGVDSDDLVFKQYDGTEVFRMEDGAYLNVSNTTASSSATTGSAIFGGGIGVAADAYVGDDAYLISDAAVLGFGADKDVTLTHVADTGLLLNAAMVIQFRDSGLTIGSNADGDLDVVSDGTAVDSINLESAGGITLDAGSTTHGITYEDDGTAMLRITNSSSDVIIKPLVDAKDLIFQQRDGTEVARVEDNGTFNIVTDKLAINGTAVTSTAAELNKLDGVGTLAEAGKQTIWVPAVAMYPNSTNGCADIAQTELSNGPEIKTLDFDKDSDEFAQFAVAFPKSWDEGTVTFQAFFTAASTNTGTTAWGLAGVALADDGSLNTAFGTTVVATAKAMSGTSNDLAVTAESGAVTIAGSPSTDEYVFFQIQRDVSADDLSADSKLLGIKLFFTTDAANDA